MKTEAYRPLTFEKGSICSPILLIGLENDFLIYEALYNPLLHNKKEQIIIKSNSLILPKEGSFYVISEKDNDGLYNCKMKIPQKMQIKKMDIPFSWIYWILRQTVLNRDVIRNIVFLLKDLRFN